MNSVAQDLKYALRQLRRTPGFTAISVLTLALGIGANTGIFTLVNAVLLKSLPVRNPEQLFIVQENDWEPVNARFSYPTFQKARAAMPRGADLAATSWPGNFYVSFGSQPEMASGQLVSGNYFQTIGTHAVLGRLLTADDDLAMGGSPVAVISYGCWERRFGRAANITGRKLTVNGMPFEVVGVTTQDFFGTEVGAAPEFWIPTVMQASVRFAQHYSEDETVKVDEPWVPQPGVRWLQFIIRAGSGQLVARTSAALNRVFRIELEQTAATIKDPQERAAALRFQLHLRPGERGLSNLRVSFSQPLLALMAMVGIILLIACANLANLLLARSATREHEIAVRLSIGAGRARLVRQLLIECLLLSLSGAALGSGVAYWLSAVLPQWVSTEDGTSIPLTLSPDAHILCFSVIVALLTGIAFGLAPAIQSTRIHPIRALKKGIRASSARTVSRWPLNYSLVALQVALSLVLVIGAGLFVQTLHNFSTFDPGFDRDHLVTVRLDTHLAGYSHTQLSALYRRLIERVEAVPGVRSAALASCEIAAGCGDASNIFLSGVPHPNGETDAQERRVSHGFFATVGIPLLRGRSFADFDTENSPAVAVVNETFVREFMHGNNPIGQYFGYDAGNTHRFQIVGVIRDSCVNDVRESVPPTIYHSLSQDVIDVESLNVRTFGDPAELVPTIREAVRSVDPNLPMGTSSTVAEVVSNALSLYRLVARLTSMFGALALGLACLGLYGVLSYTVARRTAELGIRMALGAPRGAAVWLVLRHVLLLVGTGLIAGLVLSLLSVHAIRSLLFGLSAYDPATLIGAAAIFTVVSIVAGFKPAWRAAQISLTDALRVE